MEIIIVCIGSLKEKYLKDAFLEYEKRIKRFAKIKIIELREEKEYKNSSKANENEIKKAEGERILKALEKENAFKVALDQRGEELNSKLFAQKISNITVNGSSKIAFIIGGSIGLSEEVLHNTDYKISFSKMTFAHQLFRIILMEQIYRAFKINAGEKYDK